MLSIMVTVLENGIVDPRSNPGRGCLRFTLISDGEACNVTLSEIGKLFFQSFLLYLSIM